MQITIESAELTTKISKNKKPYDTQVAYAHTKNRDGSPKRYPEEIVIFPRRNDQGTSVPYQPGEYRLDDSSFSIERGFMNLDAVRLVSFKSSK